MKAVLQTSCFLRWDRRKWRRGIFAAAIVTCCGVASARDASSDLMHLDNYYQEKLNELNYDSGGAAGDAALATQRSDLMQAWQAARQQKLNDLHSDAGAGGSTVRLPWDKPYWTPDWSSINDTVRRAQSQSQRRDEYLDAAQDPTNKMFRHKLIDAIATHRDQAGLCNVAEQWTAARIRNFNDRTPSILLSLGTEDTNGTHVRLAQVERMFTVTFDAVPDDQRIPESFDRCLHDEWSAAARRILDDQREPIPAASAPTPIFSVRKGKVVEVTAPAMNRIPGCNPASMPSVSSDLSGMWAWNETGKSTTPSYKIELHISAGKASGTVTHRLSSGEDQSHEIENGRVIGPVVLFETSSMGQAKSRTPGHPPLPAGLYKKYYCGILIGGSIVGSIDFRSPDGRIHPETKWYASHPH